MAQVFDLLWGKTGSGKSQALVELIIYLTLQSKKKARVFAGDGGTATYRNSGLVEEGLLDIVEFDDLDFPFTVADRISRGWMPILEGKDKGKFAKVNDSDYIVTIYEGAAVLAKYLLGMK